MSNLLKEEDQRLGFALTSWALPSAYEGEVTAEDARLILDKVSAMHARATSSAERAPRQERKDALRLFATNLEKSFYGFEMDF